MLISGFTLFVVNSLMTKIKNLLKSQIKKNFLIPLRNLGHDIHGSGLI